LAHRKKGLRSIGSCACRYPAGASDRLVKHL
jgi:hypothetical protein